MRVSFATLLPLVATLTAWVASANVAESNPLEAREWVDELNTRDLDFVSEVLERREVLSEFSTRDLVDEVRDRLERRGQIISKPSFKCPYCGTKYSTAKAAKDCATKPRILGGCKVGNAVRT
ncbi:hypothetical protein MD484_g2492, partial [Candolleomyces efflorescens]